LEMGLMNSFPRLASNLDLWSSRSQSPKLDCRCEPPRMGQLQLFQGTAVPESGNRRQRNNPCFDLLASLKVGEAYIPLEPWSQATGRETSGSQPAF
jgi:hypothetical protein